MLLASLNTLSQQKERTSHETLNSEFNPFKSEQNFFGQNVASTRIRLQPLVGEQFEERCLNEMSQVDLEWIVPTQPLPIVTSTIYTVQIILINIITVKKADWKSHLCSLSLRRLL